MAPDMAVHHRSSKEKKAAAKAARAKKIRRWEDDCIMGTNDSSIMSKRSVSKLYYPNEPNFYEPVTAKFQRRHPLINRGYWLRMQAVEQVVRQFLEHNESQPTAIINLGCGYDPLPFQFWHRYPKLCQNATFIDVDYPDLIMKKRIFIANSQMLTEHVPKLTEVDVGKGALLTYEDKYAAVGCDLRDLDLLDHLLKRLKLNTRRCLFVAEVSMTYMKVDDADALIKWSTSFNNGKFCLLEQYLPDGPNHPFTSTMLAHFKKLNTPLQAIPKYPRMADQRQRFEHAGWSHVEIQSLWSFWSDLSAISLQQRRHLDEVEPFDEWEEFAMFAGHYFVLVASTDANAVNIVPLTEEKSMPSISESISDPRGRLELSEAKSTGEEAELTYGIRRFAASVRHDDNVVSHGGLGTHGRLTTEDIWTYNSNDSWDVWEQENELHQSRICHTITKHDDGSLLMVGGRTSPNNVFSTCFLYQLNKWSECEPLNLPRYRHSAVAIQLGDSRRSRCGTLIMGGKGGSGEVLRDWKFWSLNKGWQEVEPEALRPGEEAPPARFGAVLTTSHANSTGLLLGGMGVDGRVLTDIYEWTLICVDDRLKLSFKRCFDVHSDATSSALSYARFGARVVNLGSDQLLIGGIGGQGVVPFSQEILRFDNLQSKFVETKIVSHPDLKRPLLIGCSASSYTVSPDSLERGTKLKDPRNRCDILVIGGGAVCFSFGSFHNRTAYLLKYGALLTGFGTVKNGATKDMNDKGAGAPRMSKVKRVRLSSKEDFDTVVDTAEPVIIEQSEIGSCVSTWTPEYLVERIGHDKEIAVHSCPTDRLTFQQKNFLYVKQAFGDFMEAISRGEKLYLRAVANEKPFKRPTHLDQDFPGIAPDFALPDTLDRVKLEMHSSPLRISGPVKLWLHYDVLANVLCQIRGHKTMRLYSPSDVGRLKFAPGSSSSNVDVFGPDQADLEGTHPFDAELKPGDTLYIPPMWMHSAMPTEGISVAVNVFFRNLDSGYAPGRDVYGNRDLQAYEQGRRDIEKMVRAFEGVPADIRRFYLERLAGELHSHAVPDKENV